MNPRIELHWFEGCPNHHAARLLLENVLQQAGWRVMYEEIDVSTEEAARDHRTAGSPTIRINGRDVEPGFVDPGHYVPSCRVYFTAGVPTGVPQREWIEAALHLATHPD